MWRTGRKTVLNLQNRERKFLIKTRRGFCEDEPPEKSSALKAAPWIGGGIVLAALGYYAYTKNADPTDNISTKITPIRDIKSADPMDAPINKNETDFAKDPKKEPEPVKTVTPVDLGDSQTKGGFENGSARHKTPCEILAEEEGYTATSTIVQQQQQEPRPDHQPHHGSSHKSSCDTLIQDMKNAPVGLTRNKDDVNCNVSTKLIDNNFAAITAPEDHVNRNSETDTDLHMEELAKAAKTYDSNHNIEDERKLEYEASAAILDDLLSCCSVAASTSILVSDAAANAVTLHSALLRTALDDVEATPEEKSYQWSDVSKALAVKEKKLHEANLYYDKATEELAKLKQVSEKMNTENDLVMEKVAVVDVNCSHLIKELQEMKEKVADSMSVAESVEKYRASLEDVKSTLQKDLALPEGTVMEAWQRESKRLKDEEDMEALRQMRLKVEELNHKLEEERSASAKQVEEEMARMRQEAEEKASRLVEEEKNKWLEEAQLQHENKLAQTKSAFEREMKERLKKQGSLHAEHLAEALVFMDRQAAEKYENALQKQIQKQKETLEEKCEQLRLSHDKEVNKINEQYQVDLNVALAKIEGIKRGLEGRVASDHQTRKAHELSLACESLLHTLKYGNDGKPTPLKGQLETVKMVYGENSSIHLISSALPKEAENRGVFPESLIRQTFPKIAKSCRKVSLVDESKNSLYVYFLSYLKSFLILSSSSTPPPEQLDPVDLGVFDIVSYANHCLQVGDIEQAVRFLNQLKGEPRKVAQAWMNEARLYLETKQAIDALCAISNSILIGAGLER